MGSKVNPRIFRAVTTFATPARWYANKKDFPTFLHQDIKIRQMIQKQFKSGGISRIEIERSASEFNLRIMTSKPGVIIGRGGVLIEELKKNIKREHFGSQKMKVNISIQEVQQPDTDAEIIMQSIRDQLEQRIPFRRALKRAAEQVMRAGAKGTKIQVSGRLNGADIARREFVAQGRLPLQTLRAKIDYTHGTAQTIYGAIGIKVWVYKGEVFEDDAETKEPVKEERKPGRPMPQRRRAPARAAAPTASTPQAQKTTLRKKADIEASKAPVAQSQPQA